ncbi:hypothetical protein [Cohnella zeiphila]|uniref:Uncharacterized protein n=1 Tax=Cohnella zeiphila TaxID=2761120 RepID=A0A7X0SJF1_9BACL|nr:hypothetical protein [Cohnella zeiphila]MBB6729899.1 hypothetical protein [Cohnella zeiphila]
MDHLMDYVQLIFSIGLIYSLALLPFSFFIAKERHWSRETVVVVPVPLTPASPARLNGIRRWMVRTVKRREAPDGDADCSFPY